MNEPATSFATTQRQSEIFKILRETLLVAVIGVLFALVANQISPRGLNLTRNYFPEIKPPAPIAATTTNFAPATADTTNSPPPPPDDPAVARLKGKGLQLATIADVKQLLHDPGYKQGSIIFIDARDDDHYQAGHIPGAYQLDYYHLEKYLPAVLPACQTAKKIVVYCTGGDCEDSEMTATTLRDGGVPNEKLFVYAGGITEWLAKSEPVETGARNSGQFK